MTAASSAACNLDAGDLTSHEDGGMQARQAS